MPQQSVRQVGKAAMKSGRGGQLGQVLLYDKQINQLKVLIQNVKHADGRTEPILINVDS
tara:strand:- start:79 stop:255 length:177 start_codon:yes stop_codon:yes gene_type:complete